MLKRTIMVTKPYRLNIRHDQLILTERETNTEHQAPVEDLGFVVLDNPYISITQAVAQELSDNNVAVVFCSPNHHPASLLLNLDGHHLQNELFRTQLEASEPLKKNLWKQTIEAKLKNQLAMLKLIGQNSPRVESLTRTVASGDVMNNEGQAARIYWPLLLGNEFLRDRYGKSPNNLLNYGYAILRAAIAKALVGSGLLPTLGIHHHNKYNAYCLADDIMEPYRPFVDRLALQVFEETGPEEDLSKESRAAMLGILDTDVKFSKYKRPLMIATSITSASLAKCFSGEIKKLAYPLM